MANAPTAQKRSFSNPALDQTLTIHSQNAQYVLQRGHSFLLVVRALYAISVVLRIIAEEAVQEAIEAAEELGAGFERWMLVRTRAVEESVHLADPDKRPE